MGGWGGGGGVGGGGGGVGKVKPDRINRYLRHDFLLVGFTFQIEVIREI